MGLSIATGGGFAALMAGNLGTLAGIGVRVGVGLALSGVSDLLWPPPKPEKFENDQDPRISFAFGGTPNTSRAGVTLPVVYGEIFTGSTIISMNVTTDQVAA